MPMIPDVNGGRGTRRRVKLGQAANARVANHGRICLRLCYPKGVFDDRPCLTLLYVDDIILSTGCRYILLREETKFMRVVKEASVRRNEILDAAERLFVTKGFDKTSTNDILEQVGIARGTLYYHFGSKEEILNAMIQRMTEGLVQRADGIFAQKDVPVLERLTRMVLALNVDSDLGHAILEQMHKPQNALMHQKMREGLLAGIVPLFTGLIEEGIAQGICQTDYPAQAAEMILLYSTTAFDDLAEHGDEERKIAAFIYHMERLLGMPRDSMLETVLPIFRA